MRRITQKGANFKPSFLVITAGQTVELPNDDRIMHNVFSLSEGNAFDVGLYPKGESRSVTFRTPGVVQLYCSIHASMNGTIFVSPSPFYSEVSLTGNFQMSRVPAGKYMLKLWNEMVPERSHEVRVREGESTFLEVAILPRSSGKSADPSLHAAGKLTTQKSAQAHPEDSPQRTSLGTRFAKCCVQSHGP